MRVRLWNPELGTRSAARTRFAKLSYCSSHRQRCCRFFALISRLVMTGVDSQTSDASASRIQ
eukprot:6447881-Pyramimonas_sp.AAC.1